MRSTERFFDEMAATYDEDIEELAWDPRQVVAAWPFPSAPPSSVLDLACGTGALLGTWSGSDAQLAGLDLSSAMLRRARRRLGDRASLYRADIAGAWPVPSASFSCVTCFGALEFVRDLGHVWSELQRVLAPSGEALVTIEDVCSWEGSVLEEEELRYGLFPLWRRRLAGIVEGLPSDLVLGRSERIRAYRMVERGYTTAYWALHLRRGRGDA